MFTDINNPSINDTNYILKINEPAGVAVSSLDGLYPPLMVQNCCMNYSEKLKDPRWQKKRLEILTRDEWECKICCTKEKTLNVHHIGYSGNNPWETENNLLLTLCEDCHNEETDNLSVATKNVIHELRGNGFMAMSFSSLAKIFEKNRGWDLYDPAFDVLKMVVDDDNLWEYMHEIFFERMREKRKKEICEKLGL